MALLANKVGVPARVVMGAVVPEDGVVRGEDVSAWVELQVADGTWKTLPTDAFMDFDRPGRAAAGHRAADERHRRARRPPRSRRRRPWPSRTTPSSTPARSTAPTTTPPAAAPAGGAGCCSAPAGRCCWSLLVVGTIVGLKAWRRRRRRAAARASARVVGGWRELVDHARDLGQPVPVGAGLTRRQQAPHVATPAALDLARTADGIVFGPADPDEAVAAEFWSMVDEERRAMTEAVPSAAAAAGAGRPALVPAVLRRGSFEA